jgi:hypothetical protein
MQNNNNNSIYNFLYEQLVLKIKNLSTIKAAAWEIIGELGHNSQNLGNFLHITDIAIKPIICSENKLYESIVNLVVSCEKSNIRTLKQIIEQLRVELHSFSFNSEKFILKHGNILEASLKQEKNLRWESKIQLKGIVIEKT